METKAFKNLQKRQKKKIACRIRRLPNATETHAGLVKDIQSQLAEKLMFLKFLYRIRECSERENV